MSTKELTAIPVQLARIDLALAAIEAIDHEQLDERQMLQLNDAEVMLTLLRSDLRGEPRDEDLERHAIERGLPVT